MSLPRFALILTLSIVQIAFGDLQSQAEKIVATTDLKKGTAAVCVIDTATGKALIKINENISMIPASNQKLLTTGAALHVLGPTFTFQTKLLKDGDNLIVVGDGDPTLGDTSLLGITDWSKERSILDAQLEPWIQAAKKAGITSVGTLYIDDRISLVEVDGIVVAIVAVHSRLFGNIDFIFQIRIVAGNHGCP